MEVYRSILIRILFTVIILSSCSKEKGINYYDLYSIEKKQNEAIKVNYYMLFCANNTQICQVDASEIYYSYMKNKISGAYDDYFNAILNHKLSMEVDLKDHVCFTINKVIEQDYKNLNRNDFLKKYAFISADKKRFLINNKIKENDGVLNVAYFLFKNGFGITFDDYLGSYYVNDFTQN
ncbi:hypothetical protein PQ462_10945 [Flavobacterium sp. KACC 22758]|uniref:hypothetical protein n=1 Tax=Flavobacterium sp. KACC 22758 TaxID=3025667 RepID=UPI0023653C5A|nr:hypothetical protein [Flavobacterium sp. KACC 22758]WDF61883.1 hypothetical protein PQ462_10945 [Flavobacterium sp. KACC 22758]